MFVVELALQGMRGFPPLVRMELKPGLNVWRCPDSALRSSLIDATYHAFFPDPSRGSATAHLVGGDPSRIAVTFFGRDKITYRILRDAANGATKLYKFENDKYQMFTNVAQEAAQYLRVQQRIPDEVGYERLFVFSPQTMPSRGAKARSRSGALIVAPTQEWAPSGPGMPQEGPMFGAPPRMMSNAGPPSSLPRSVSGFGSSMNMTNALVLSEIEASSQRGAEPAPEAPPIDLEEKKAQLIELRNEFQAAQRAEQAQAELDQLNLRRFELTEKAERVKKIEGEHRRLTELYEKSSDLRALPLGFATRIERFEELEKKHVAERTRAYEEVSALDQEVRAFSVVALNRDPYFVGGILAAVVVVALAILLPMPALAWLNVLAMVIAAGGAFRYVGDLEQKHKLGMRHRSAGDRLERIERQHGDDTRAARDLMQKLEISSPTELLERVRGYEKLQGQIRVAEEALRQLMGDPEIAAAKTELDQLNLRVEVLESEILGATSVVSADTLSKRIRALELELGPNAPSPEIVRPPPQRRTSSSFFPPPDVLPRADSTLSADIPVVPPFTESGQTAPAPVSSTRVSVRPAQVQRVTDDEDGYGSGYGGKKGPSRGGGAGFSSSSPGWFAIGYGGPPGARGGSGLGGYGGYGEDSGGAMAADRSRDLFHVAIDLLSIEVDDLAQRIGVRLGQYLTAFTDKTYREARFGARGELTVIDPEGEEVRYGELTDETLDMVDSALRFTLIEACLTQVRIPVLFDDPFKSFPPKKRKLLGQMLGYLANTTQVVVLTEQDDIGGHELRIG